MYCGITLDWDYTNRHIDISMRGYIKNKLQEYGHILPPQNAGMSILTGTKTIWDGVTRPPPSQRYAKT